MNNSISLKLNKLNSFVKSVLNNFINNKKEILFTLFFSLFLFSIITFTTLTLYVFFNSYIAYSFLIVFCIISSLLNFALFIDKSKNKLFIVFLKSFAIAYMLFLITLNIVLKIKTINSWQALSIYFYFFFLLPILLTALKNNKKLKIISNFIKRQFERFYDFVNNFFLEFLFKNKVIEK